MHLLWWWSGGGPPNPYVTPTYDDEYLWLGEGRDGVDTISTAITVLASGTVAAMSTRLGPAATTSTLSTHLDADIGTEDIFPND